MNQHRKTSKNKKQTTTSDESVGVLVNEQTDNSETSSCNGNTADDDDLVESYNEEKMVAVFNRIDQCKDLLETMEIFRHASDGDLTVILGNLKKVEYKDGKKVLVEGEIGRDFYIIDDGCAAVYQQRLSDGVDVKVGRLTRGSYFGGVALFMNVPNAATVVAEGKLVCAQLSADHFRRFMKPVVDILKEHADTYKSFTDLIV
ncbi:unnamed protein product [Rotaria sp. Silwood2]|nr:unnamed protein product [Rotaria sp. Silwood2]